MLHTHIRDAAGNSLDGNADGIAGVTHVDEFFRLFADSDSDRSVNLLDFAAFRQAFGSISGDSAFNEAFDSSNDGSINLLDFAAFRQSFGSST